MVKPLSILILLLSIHMPCFGYFDFSSAHEHAYNEVFSMHFNDATREIALLKKNYPKNACNYLLESERDFLRAFISEERADFDTLINGNEKRLHLIENENTNSPYFRYVKSELLLHNAYTRLKYKQYIKAAFEVRKAYKLLEDNKKKFPLFKPTLKGLGILHCFMAAIPENYKWVASLVGLTGTIEGGIGEMNELLLYSDTHKELEYLHNENLVWLIFIETHLNKHENRSLELIKKYKDVYTSPLTVFSVGNVYYHYQQNDSLVSLLENYKCDSRTYPMIFLHYFKGVAYLNKLDQRGVKEFLYYIHQYKGMNYFKGAYQRLAWLALLRNDAKEYENMISKCLTEGNDFVDEDLLAVSESQNKERPNITLLRARLLFDGGYHAQSLKELAGKSSADFPTFREKLEYVYRTARVFEMLKNEQQAIELYSQTIKLGKDKRYQFAANSAYFIGQIYEVNKNYSQAKKYYLLCLSMRDHDYQNSMDQKAKAGLDRIQKK